MDQIAVRQETCSLVMVRRIAAMLDQEPDAWVDGDVLPRGWHFILLGADTKRSLIREDGFPGLGIPLPDLGLPRLVLGGRTVRYHGNIHVGSVLRRESRIEKVTEKDTPSGRMAIVTVSHALSVTDALAPALEETQTYLMLSARYSATNPASPSDVVRRAATKRVVPDDILLFQYSALGFNSHRVHLDRQFAHDAEGLPDLVVNGGLALLLLTEFLRTELGGTFTTLAARHLAPLFRGQPVLLGGERQGNKWMLKAWDDSGRLALEVDATV